jgi:hypothetical protein
MAIVPLPLPPAAEARALLHHVLEHGDIVGRDAGQTIIQLAVDDCRDGEPDNDAECDGPPVLPLDMVRSKIVRLGETAESRHPGRGGKGGRASPSSGNPHITPDWLSRPLAALVR